MNCSNIKQVSPDPMDISPFKSDFQMSAPAPRKRTRTTPEQLEILEETFSSNPNPTGSVRELLSERLSMTERAVQVWFQNRRAKAKLLQKRASLGDVHRPMNSTIAPYINTINFSINSLTIGTWRRMCIRHGDFQCQANIITRRFDWEFEESNILFKISFPFEIVSGIIFEQESSMMAKICIQLSQIPDFFMRQGHSESQAAWLPCQDFTQGKQASFAFDHNIFGNFQNLKNELSGLIELAPMLKPVTHYVFLEHNSMDQNINWARRGSMPVINTALYDSPIVSSCQTSSSHRSWLRRSSAFSFQNPSFSPHSHVGVSPSSVYSSASLIDPAFSHLQGNIITGSQSCTPLLTTPNEVSPIPSKAYISSANAVPDIVDTQIFSATDQTLLTSQLDRLLIDPILSAPSRFCVDQLFSMDDFNLVANDQNDFVESFLNFDDKSLDVKSNFKDVAEVKEE